MRTALVTGATGYIGGVLGAEIIRKEGRILCPVRGEPGRVAAQVRETYTGFGWGPAPDDLDARIAEIPWDLPALRFHPWLREVGVAFHSAVEMSFSPLRLTESFDFNLRGTLDLYDLLAECAPSGPRFFYISTAYTGGLGEGFYPEALHTAPRILNPYQGSKWATELALHFRQGRSPSLPTVIFRPTVVVGHSRTGWYGGKSYGLYNYLDSVQAGMAAGGEDLRFGIDPEVAHDYLFIDTLLEDIRALMELEDQPFAVAHSTGTRNTNQWRMERIAREFGIPIHFGKPLTKADRIANKNQPFNEPFNAPGLTWDFESRHISALMAKAIGRGRQVTPMDDVTFACLLKWYRANRLS